MKLNLLFWKKEKEGWKSGLNVKLGLGGVQAKLLMIKNESLCFGVRGFSLNLLQSMNVLVWNSVVWDVSCAATVYNI